MFATKIPQPMCNNFDSGVCLGVDEAGRGPVLGPMVYACAFWRISDQDLMSKRDYDDSKKLTEQQRLDMFDQIQQDDRIGYVVCELPARTLSEQMLRVPEPVSLNKIAHEATVEMIQKVIQSGVIVREIFVDAVGNCEIYEKMLSAVFPDSKVCVRPKADSLFKVVSAASVCAKVARDHKLANWVFPEAALVASTDWGCGYPGDEKTKKWLLDNIDPVFGFPNVVRFSWQTTKTLLDPPPNADNQDQSTRRNAARVSFPSEENRTGAVSVADMFRRSSSRRCNFYSTRGMMVVNDAAEVGK